jgi:DNA-binding MarR family transcriptional regulator
MGLRMKMQERKEFKGSVLEDLLGYHLRRASIRDLNDFARVLGDEIRPVPFTVLCLIDEEPGITASDICRKIGLQRANLAPMLAELEGRSLIERRADREDHRVQRLHLSGAGTAALAGWRARVLEREARLFGNLTQAERGTLLRLLTKLWKED